MTKKQGTESSVKSTGRPSLYNQELADRICSLVAAGEDVKGICASVGISLSVLHLWREKYSDFMEAYGRARHRSGEASESRVQSILDDARAGKIDANTARVLLDGEKWLAAKHAPRTHGDKVQVEHEGGGGGLGAVVVQIMAYQPVAPAAVNQAVSPTAALGGAVEAIGMPGVVCQIRSTQDEGAQ